MERCFFFVWGKEIKSPFSISQSPWVIYVSAVQLPWRFQSSTFFVCVFQRDKETLDVSFPVIKRGLLFSFLCVAMNIQETTLNLDGGYLFDFR